MTVMRTQPSRHGFGGLAARGVSALHATGERSTHRGGTWSCSHWEPVRGVSGARWPARYEIRVVIPDGRWSARLLRNRLPPGRSSTARVARRWRLAGLLTEIRVEGLRELGSEHQVNG